MDIDFNKNECGELPLFCDELKIYRKHIKIIT